MDRVLRGDPRCLQPLGCRNQRSRQCDNDNKGCKLPRLPAAVTSHSTRSKKELQGQINFLWRGKSIRMYMYRTRAMPLASRMTSLRHRCGRTTTAIHISGTFFSQKNGEGGSETDDYFHREDLTKHHQREVTSCLLTQSLK